MSQKYILFTVIDRDCGGVGGDGGGGGCKGKLKHDYHKICTSIKRKRK